MVWNFKRGKKTPPPSKQGLYDSSMSVDRKKEHLSNILRAVVLILLENFESQDQLTINTAQKRIWTQDHWQHAAFFTRNFKNTAIKESSITHLITAPLRACLTWSSSGSSAPQGITSASVYLVLRDHELRTKQWQPVAIYIVDILSFPCNWALMQQTYNLHFLRKQKSLLNKKRAQYISSDFQAI